MSYNSEIKKQSDDGLNLDTALMYFKKLIDKWWIIVASAVILALLGFIVAKITYRETYSSRITFIASNKSSLVTVAGQSASDLSASASLAESFKYVFTTTNLAQTVANNCGYEVTAEQVKKFVKVNSIENTAIINLSVTTVNKDVSYSIANAYAQNYAAAINEAFPNTALTIIDPPLVAEKPNANNSVIIYTLLGFIIGAVLSCLFLILSIMFKDTIKNSEDITSKLGMKVLGVVSKVQRKNKKDHPKQGILITDKKSGFAFIESYKLIRTKIEHSATKQDYKTIVVSSTMENEGKTTVATNLALSLAQNNKSVLLIDCDLRKPSVAKTLGFNANDDDGICGVIDGSKTLKESIKYSEKYQLFVLVTGKAVENSSEVLSSPKMEEIIETAKKEFDFVIIDTPPCGIIADASIISAFSDTIVLVVKQDYASARRIKRAVENFENSGTEIIGCIFNNIESNSFTTNTIYDKKYGYGYGYGYGVSQTKKK